MSKFPQYITGREMESVTSDERLREFINAPIRLLPLDYESRIAAFCFGLAFGMIVGYAFHWFL